MRRDAKRVKVKSLGLAQFSNRFYTERVHRSALATRFVKGTFWSFSGAVISRVFTLVGFIVVARILGRDEFGKLGIIQVTVAMFQIFAGFGLGLTATKYVSEFRVNQQRRAGRIVALSLLVATMCGAVLSVALVLFARPLAVQFLGSPELTPILRISAAMLFFLALNGYQLGTLAGLECFKAIAKVNLMVGLLSFCTLVAGTYAYGLRGAVWGLAGGAFLNWAITQWQLRSELSSAGILLDFRHCLAEARLLGQFSVPAILSGALVMPVSWICSAMLVRTPNGYGQMGIYNAMNQWFAALLFLPFVIEQVTLPLISERLAADDDQQSRKLLSLSIKVNALMVGPLIALGCLASPLIIRLYGRDFQNSSTVLVVVLITAGLAAIQAPVGQLLAASDRMWLGFLMNMGWAVTILIATGALINRGAIGLALARMIAYSVHCIWTLSFAYHFVTQHQRPLQTVTVND